MQSQHLPNKFANYTGLIGSILAHSIVIFALFYIPSKSIKPAPNKPIKINLNAFEIPQTKTKIVTAPQIAEIVQIPEPTPPAPTPPQIKPPEPAPKPKPKKPKPKEPKIVQKPAPLPPEPKPEPILPEPEPVPPAPVANVNPQNLPPTPEATKMSAPVDKIGEINLASSTGDENFDKVAAAIKKHRKYPKNARKMRHQGVAEVKFLLTPDGLVSDIRVIKSSGYESLDSSAVETIKRASSEFPKFDNSYYISIPISYKLI